MAQSGDSGVTMYAGLVIVLLIAVAALALFKFNMFNVNDLLSNSGDDRRGSIGRDGGSADGSDTGDGGEDGGENWSGEMPPADKYYKSHSEPLPKTITVTKTAGGETIEVEMCLVPQGWFIMGENDGVRSNMPKRWIWLDDYYISKTEFTNTQFYGFILADGYRKSQYWSQEGFAYIQNQVRYRGSAYIGWLPLERTNHLWGLASPRTDSDETMTLEVLESDGILGAPDCTVLVLPSNQAGTFIDVDNVGDQVNVRMKFRDEWRDIDGLDLRNDTDRNLKEEGLLHITNSEGRADLSGIRSSREYTIVAWVDGDKSNPVMGRLRRSESPFMRDGNMPVVELSWFEADACCRYFGGELPTEAQWEKAGRGTTGKLFAWGDELDMNLFLPDATGTKRHTTPHANLNRWRIKPVGSFPTGASEYGVEDLVGNVSEWCRDVYIEIPKWDERNPLSRGGAQDRRSERGSSTHDDDPQTAKLHNRRYSDPYARGVDTRGFRLVLDPATALKMAK
ncbi:MAG: SUMF1/EgtB/PvdO family nonheme iron enzyme [Planctomycetes bacterium]|nr:SUMF1/EgtB/PvdO family nonheme iron enzyme [Planctomycetota bacterium]